MTRICVLSHSFQHSAQMRASMSAPSEPGSPTFPAPSRSCPHRAQMTPAMPSSYKRPPSKPAHPRNGSVPENSAAEDVGELHRAESPAVRALLRAVAEDRAPPVRHSGDSLQHQAFGLPRVADEHDLADAGRAPQTRNDDPVTGAERGFHASACHRDAAEHAILGPGCGRLLQARGLRPTRLGPDVADLVDHVEQGPRLRDVERALDLRALFRGLPAELGDLGVLLNVLGLEVIAPENVDVVLRELGLLLLDDDGARLELVVSRRVV